MTRASFKERYMLSISDDMNAKGISTLLGVNRAKALDIRKEAITYCLRNHIPMYGKNSVPTEAVLLVSHKTIDYFYQKMLLEAKAI